MSEIEQATFGAGCFWGAEAAFRELEGVVDTRVGFASAANDAHLKIEVVQVDFDPAQLSYSHLIEHFWALHDPTSVDRQGADAGVKYRSAIFTHSAQQQASANSAKQLLEVSGRLSKPVVTHVLALGALELADEDQQRYLEKHGKTSCSI
ncbi:Peptide methionine sulfoxide reductase MsrA 3 [Pseudomonas fluorescens]|uniref:Peptide methionine sulfoxide reductase MsrA n=1 Tax=Pseudomonas fluorescens TaxID=294 RepID=A0A5E7SS06_PSEFL|nr:peptide-methionine (S)-S-oxide reductase MsrA [Pseudomonas fluorescens]VVP88884.1 Peptide methionine sulfoxide reductase MsrA 3 [Pseudomonas fluorescens]